MHIFYTFFHKLFTATSAMILTFGLVPTPRDQYPALLLDLCCSVFWEGNSRGPNMATDSGTKMPTRDFQKVYYSIQFRFNCT